MALTWQRCDACGAAIVFPRHDRTGKPAPLHRDPEGRWTVHGESYFQASPQLRPEERYTSHFATCPGASGFRRRSSGAPAPAEHEQEG